MAESPLLGTVLSASSTQNGTYLPLYGLSNVPDMSFAADQVEVTNFSDKNKRFVPGIIDLGNPEFEFFNNDALDVAEQIKNSYQYLRAAELDHTALWFKLVYPDGTGFQWQAYVITTRVGGGPSDALSFRAQMLFASNIIDIPGIGILTFTCTTGSSAGNTKVASVSPVLTSGNSYVYVVGDNLELPTAGASVAGAPYTLGTNITASAVQHVMLIEVTAAWRAVKAGIAVAVPAS
ncbi:hypothetical protein SAMN02745823_03891 [Sporobacter termitidis DSM 10068]|uniref:S-layer protein SbsC C-terminal domain-containing protein n=1 Tax=Sporobacter termitidis DSM 10068 TaxID=1123282 RepID=A0A1M5ZLH7_9FIRM|nr:hypothetical protein [Sporobacter termitidis]SHI25012.1 hypothetical protein SAMN02745823_03891 [Sporobacter termitidis DSM 10068]